MVGSSGCLKEQSSATDLDDIMASSCQGWELQVARTANRFVMVEDYHFTS